MDLPGVSEITETDVSTGTKLFTLKPKAIEINFVLQILPSGHAFACAEIASQFVESKISGYMFDQMSL